MRVLSKCFLVADRLHVAIRFDRALVVTGRERTQVMGLVPAERRGERPFVDRRELADADDAKPVEPLERGRSDAP